MNQSKTPVLKGRWFFLIFFHFFLVSCSSSFTSSINQADSSGPLGMTWGVFLRENEPKGYVNVSCHGSPGLEQGKVSSNSYAPSCNAYLGDTSCNESLPVLCIRKIPTLTKPSGLVLNEHDAAYNGWSGGELKLTEKIVGTKLTSLSYADDFCKKQFGSGWEIAEHGDGHGSGWGLWAKGKLDSGSRFWVSIDTQRSNCWDSALPPPVVIPNPPAVPTVSFTVSSQSVAENVGTVTVAAQVSAASTQAVTVPYTILGTALSLDDYTIGAPTIEIPAGATTASISFGIVDDTVVEPDETMILTLGTPTNATLGVGIEHTITITNND